MCKQCVYSQRPQKWGKYIVHSGDKTKINGKDFVVVGVMLEHTLMLLPADEPHDRDAYVYVHIDDVGEPSAT
jgi:hypothetical protein